MADRSNYERAAIFKRFKKITANLRTLANEAIEQRNSDVNVQCCVVVLAFFANPDRKMNRKCVKQYKVKAFKSLTHYITFGLSIKPPYLM